MKSHALASAALALFLACGPAAAQQQTPLEKYQEGTNYALLACGLTFKIAQAQAELGKATEDGDYRACITQNVEQAKKNLTPALRTVRKPAAQAALKAHYVAFATALRGIDPGVNERKISYEQRQQALSDKVTEAWEKFEVER